VKSLVKRVEVLLRIEGHTIERFKIELRIGNQCLRQSVLLSFAEPFPCFRLHCFSRSHWSERAYGCFIYDHEKFMAFFLLILLSGYLNNTNRLFPAGGC
jgi:hypothetical protein